MSAPPPDLRAIVAEVVREVVAQTVAARAAATPPQRGPEPPAPRAVAGAEHVTPASPRTRTDRVRISDDADLDRFVRTLLALFENPKNRQDLRAGRLRFRLEAAAVPGAGVDRPALRVDSGAVTERRVEAAAEAGQRILLGRRAVLTPLARDRARALGVSIEKER